MDSTSLGAAVLVAIIWRVRPRPLIIFYLAAREQYRRVAANFQKKKQPTIQNKKMSASMAEYYAEFGDKVPQSSSAFTVWHNPTPTEQPGNCNSVSIEEHYLDGKLYRLDGAARITKTPDGRCWNEYWVNGKIQPVQQSELHLLNSPARNR